MALTIQDLYDEVDAYGHQTPEYHQKYMHRVPDAQVVERMVFLMACCKDKTVLHMGCASGPLDEKLRSVARRVYGFDRDDVPDRDHFYRLDFEREELPELPEPIDVVVCGEILEHMSNPGQFLDKVRPYCGELVITVPNAFSDGGVAQLKRGFENVNDSHVAYYSYKTLDILVVRHGFRRKEMYWYNGQPKFSEGLIFVCEPT